MTSSNMFEISYRSFFKPLIDYILVVIALTILFPIFIIIGILIKLNSQGPVFFVQERLGYKEKPFKLYKFRTMTHKDRKVHRQIYEGDPEVTKMGRILRRLKLDELPQLINVLKGEMAIVGPRPCLEALRKKFDENTPCRFLVKPGLTSLAALKGSIYLSWAEKWHYDKVYVEKLSFLLDMEIILKTIILIFVGEKNFARKFQN